MSVQDTKGPPSSLSDAINMLMENPQIISSVAAALGNMSQNSDNAAASYRKEEEAPSDTPAASDLSSLISSLTPLMSDAIGGRSHSSPAKKTESGQREALLYALKPYVSQSRQEAIDYIIRISRMSEVLKTIGS